jgi:predicted  nucleic acid-binding Zn-ribbon protein
MSDSWDRAGGPPVDADAFQEWVTHTAESRGVDERELINQLVSAYWVLDEMNDVGGDVDGPPAVGPRSQKGTDTGESDDDGIGGDDVTRDDHVAGDDDDVAGGSDARPGGERGESAPGSAGVDEGGRSATDDAISHEINALRSSIQTQFEVSQAVTELRREVSDLSLEVETQRSRREEFTDRITDELTRLHGRVESIDTGSDGDTELQDQIDEVTHELERVEGRIAGLEGAVDGVQTDQQELDAWVDDEFDDIESLFRDLIDRSDTHAARMDDLDERLEALQGQLGETEADLQPALEAAADREAIADLRREALEAGVDAAACARCGTTVDLSMLDEPVCPGCEATFHGVDADTPLWNPFASPTLTTAPARFDAE